MREIKDTKDGFSRRAFVSGAAKTFLGVSAMPMMNGIAQAAAAQATPLGGSATSCIYLYMSGGMSHLDTFDTKPGAETQGPVESINTNADGVRISQYLPSLAKHMDKVCLINSMNSTQGAHEQGRYFMHTSYSLRGTVRHPDMGAWTAFHLGKENRGLPSNVKIGGSSTGLGGGFLESRFAALPIGNPSAGLQHSKLPRSVDDEKFERRMSRVRQMNKLFTETYDTKQARAYAEMYDEAVRLMKSKDLEVFDLTQESQEKRDAYGSDSFGQACLLARRLVENKVRFVEVNYGGWDTHEDNFTRVEQRCATLDQALSTLLADLASLGLLQSTLVVVATEFGRTPTIQSDRNNGRNHFPQAFSCLLAGGGIKGGLKYGRTDKEGREVMEDMVTIPDFNATIAHALGLPIEKKTMSPDMRPFTVADKGLPILDLFS